MRTRVLVAGLTAGLAMSLAACSSPGSTTCADYAALSSTERDSLITTMVKDHDLDPSSNVYGLVLLGQDVDRFCGVSLGSTGPVRNAGRAIEDGVAWSEYGA